MSLTVKLEARQSRSGNRARISVAAVLSSTPTGAAYGLAGEVQRRVFQRGRPVDRVPSHDGTGAKLVSPRYPGAERGKEGATGVRIFPSGQAFQQSMGARRGSYNVSGGLAEGMTVVTYGKRAYVQFRGRSEGQEPNFRKLKRGTVAKGRKVSNALKAATVLKAHGVNLLKVRSDELEALAIAVQTAVRDAVPAIGGYKIEWASGTQGRSSARRILAAIRGVRRIRP